MGKVNEPAKPSSKVNFILEMGSATLYHMLCVMRPLENDKDYFKKVEETARIYSNMDIRNNTLNICIIPFLSCAKIETLDYAINDLSNTKPDDRLFAKLVTLSMQFPNTKLFEGQYDLFLEFIKKENNTQVVTEEMQLEVYSRLASYYHTNIKSVMCKHKLDEYLYEQTKDKSAGYSYQLQKKQQ